MMAPAEDLRQLLELEPVTAGITNDQFERAARVEQQIKVLSFEPPG